jgi:hypothetical protein
MRRWGGPLPQAACATTHYLRWMDRAVRFAILVFAAGFMVLAAVVLALSFV